jgi:hypothetical protein
MAQMKTGFRRMVKTSLVIGYLLMVFRCSGGRVGRIWSLITSLELTCVLCGVEMPLRFADQSIVD